MPPEAIHVLRSGDPSAWDQALYAFLVESYSRMLWPVFAGTTPDRVKPAGVLAYGYGIGRSGRAPSGATISARIACWGIDRSYFKLS
jgi:hypothetical protein